MRLSKLGASGGLNLMWDQFAADLGGKHFGKSDADVILTPDWEGLAPPDADTVVIARRGVDLNPLEQKDTADQLRLRAYRWPSQPDRMAHTVAVIDAFDAQVDQADAIDWLADQMAYITGQTHLVFHTIAWQYLPAYVQARGTTLIAAAGAKATDHCPLAWFGMEPDGQSFSAAMTLRIWPSDITIDLGCADFHGRWVQWKG